MITDALFFVFGRRTAISATRDLLWLLVWIVMETSTSVSSSTLDILSTFKSPSTCCDEIKAPGGQRWDSGFMTAKTIPGSIADVVTFVTFGGGFSDLDPRMKVSTWKHTLWTTLP